MNKPLLHAPLMIRWYMMRSWLHIYAGPPYQKLRHPVWFEAMIREDVLREVKAANE